MGRQPGALTLSEDDRRVLAVWAADCAERTLSLFEAQAPTDTRPRDAIEGLRAFARGDMRIGAVRALAARAHAAAREIGDPGAVAAARAAGQAASVAHMAAMRAAWPTPPRPPGWPHRMIRPPSPARPGGSWATPRRPFGRSCGASRPRPTGMLGTLINDMHKKLTAGG
jgi:immunity protein 5 of polymorphic toxin system